MEGNVSLHLLFIQYIKLNMTKEELKLCISNNKEICITKIREIIKNILPECTTVKINDENILEIFNKDYAYPILISFGDNFDINGKFTLRTNISSINDHFDIFLDEAYINYIAELSTILKNKEFLVELKNILYKYFYKVKDINLQLYQIEQNEANNYRKKIEEQRYTKLKAEFDYNVKMLSENPNAEVVIKLYKDNIKQTGFSYKNYPAEILNVYDSESYTAYCEAKRLNKNIGKHANFLYKAIDVSQIKIEQK
jgi:hypothetical protein